MFKKTIMIVLMLFAFSGIAFAEQVLIAGSKSDFKNALVAKVVKELNDRKITSAIVPLKQLKELDESKYDLLVLISSCIAFKPAPQVKKFLKKVKNKEKIIVVTTVGNEKWGPKNLEVDAITTASTIVKVDEIANELVIKVVEKLM